MFGPDPYDPAAQMAASLAHLPPEEAKEVVEHLIRQAERPPRNDDDAALPIMGGIFVLVILVAWGFVSLAGWLGRVVLAHQLETAVYVFFAVALCTVALLFYRLRCRHRLAYGMCEVAFGAVSIFYASHGLLQYLIDQSSGSSGSVTPNTTFALIAGLYVIVRGLSNIEDALRIRRAEKASTRLERLWLRLFYEPRPRAAGAEAAA